MQITAAVAREKFGRFSIEPVELTDPRPDELLVKVAQAECARPTSMDVMATTTRRCRPYLATKAPALCSPSAAA
jgi:Zn-dependent alcohol dehydrogenase